MIMRWLLFLYAIHCGGCGTEVGNGRSGDRTSPGASGTVMTPSTDTRAESGTPTTEASSGNTNYPDFYPWLLAPCATPLTETDNGTYVADASYPPFSVALQADSARKVSFPSMEFLVVPASPLYSAVVSPSPSEAFTCGPVMSASSADGSVLRKVTINQAKEVRWYVKAAVVSKIEIKDLMTDTTLSYSKSP